LAIRREPEQASGQPGHTAGLFNFKAQLLISHVSGEVMTTVRSTPTTDEMSETREAAQAEAAYVLAPRVRRENGLGTHGNP
jgi:hypothetical protein